MDETATAEVQQLTVDGVPAVWAYVPGDAYGFLVFGVGQRDLDPGTAGLHHLVEHLVMRRVGRVATEHNAMSSPDTVVFHASGTRDDVVAFLRAVVGAVAGLGSVTAEEVAAERSTILTEVGPDAVYAASDALAHRWGPGGLGLVDLGHVALPFLSVDDVRAFAGRWLTTGAASLATTFEPPADLLAGLPVGAAPARPPHPVALPGATPAYGVSTTDGVSLSFLVRMPHALRELVATVLEETFVRQVRLDRGLVYDASLLSFRVDGETSAWVLLLDPQDGAVDEVVLLARSVVEDLVASGPDPDVLAHARAAVRSRAASVDGRIGDLLSRAELMARGEPAVPLADVVAAAEAASADDVRTAVASFAPSLLLLAPGRVGIQEATEEALAAGLALRRPLAGYADMTPEQVRRDLLTDGRPESGRGSVLRPAMSVHKGRFFSPWRGSEIWIGRNQVALTDLGARVRAEDVVLLGEDDDGDVEVVTRQGGVVTLPPDAFRGARRPWDAFVAGLPPEVVRHKRGYPVRPPS